MEDVVAVHSRAFCRPLRPVLLLVSFPRSRSPAVGVLGLCWMWHGVPFARQRRPWHTVATGLAGQAIPPLCDIPSGCCSFTGPWTVTRSSLRMLRRVATFCRPLRPVLLLVSFLRSRSPAVGVPGLC